LGVLNFTERANIGNLLRDIFKGTKVFKDAVTGVEDAISRYDTSLRDFGLIAILKNVEIGAQTKKEVEKLNRKLEDLGIVDFATSMRQELGFFGFAPLILSLKLIVVSNIWRG
jgi:hypothetical protein